MLMFPVGINLFVVVFML